MNVQAYISSGIVESYVLGLASPEEQAEFERMAAQYPEVLQARIEFELQLEQQAFANAVTPPASLKQQIRQSLSIDVPPITQAPVRSMNVWKYAAAASVLLLIGCVVWNLSLRSVNRELQDQVTGTTAQLRRASQQLDSMQGNMAAIVQNPNMKMAVMKGLDPAPKAFATVYCDTASHDVYLITNNLPTPASDKQYQLWAIFNGKPVDLGVFDIRREKLLIQAKNAQGAEAFAITLEEKGGSPTPKGQMYVMGNL